MILLQEILKIQLDLFSKILQECISCRRKVFPTGINSSQVVILYEIKIFYRILNSYYSLFTSYWDLNSIWKFFNFEILKIL